MIKADYVFAVDCHNLMIKKAIQTCALISRGEYFTDMVSSQCLNFTDTSSDSLNVWVDQQFILLSGTVIT